jgi:hypothetical protein
MMVSIEAITLYVALYHEIVQSERGSGRDRPDYRSTFFADHQGCGIVVGGWHSWHDRGVDDQGPAGLGLAGEIRHHGSGAQQLAG